MNRRSVLVGYGYWGKIISRYLKDAGFDPVYVFDRHAEIPFENFLAEKQAEAVFICSPVSTHYEYVKTALEAGCDVFCEKMLTADPVKARELYDLADEKGRVLFTDYIYLYSPSIRKMKELTGNISPIDLIKCEIHQNGKIYDDVDVIGNIGVHMISAAGFLTDFNDAAGSSVKLSDLSEVPLKECTLDYRINETEVSISASLVSDEKTRNISAFGAGGELHFDMMKDITLRQMPDLREFSFDEGNNLVNSLSAFRKCLEDPSGDEYALNRSCCSYTECIVYLALSKI